MISLYKLFNSSHMIKNYPVIVDIMNFNKLIQIINEVQTFEEIQ